MDVIYTHCAGLDVHKQTVVACSITPGPRGEKQFTVRTFGTMTTDLLALSDWLATQGVVTVAGIVADPQAKLSALPLMDAGKERAEIQTKTGQILALANWPSYNPNDRAKLSGSQLRNRAITDLYEPGSTLKPFTAALAMDSGKFRPETVINCAPGRLTIGNATISDAHPHGALTVAQVIEKSSNVGVTKMALTLPSKDMWEMFDAVGFGQFPRLGFPGEVTGRVRPWKNWRPIEQATMSYGHGISVSLIQLARAYAIFARDGETVPLTLIRSDEPPAHGVRVFSPQTAHEKKLDSQIALC